MPFILGERDTKDSAHTLLHMPKNKRRRLDKNLKRQAAFSPLCSPFACVCAQVQTARSRQRATGMLAIDEGLIDATDVGQPAAPKKKKRSDGQRKSANARQNDTHGRRGDAGSTTQAVRRRQYDTRGSTTHAAGRTMQTVETTEKLG